MFHEDNTNYKNEKDVKEHRCRDKHGNQTLMVRSKHTGTWKEEQMSKKPTIVCICGSTRFADQHAIARWELERTGQHICLMINYLPAGYAEEQGWVGKDHFAEAAGLSAVLDELHLRKIDLADKVLVINVGGYFGKSTAMEVAYAEHTGKPVEWLENSSPPGPWGMLVAARERMKGER